VMRVVLSEKCPLEEAHRYMRQGHLEPLINADAHD
jgi:hypothetical protein